MRMMDEVRWGQASSLVKLCCGICNNASWYVMTDALDRVKTLPVYRQNVKKAFSHVLDEWKAYERNLLYSKAPRFFHLDDMAPETRKKFGCCSDAEYYDFWTGIGGDAYGRSKLLASSLANKYKLSLEKHGVKYAEQVGWLWTGMTALEIACKMWTASVNEASKQFGLPIAIAKKIFGCFNLDRVRRSYSRAMSTVNVSYESIKLEDGEKRNIELGIIQLEEAWSDPERMIDSTIQATEDYSEIFATKGTVKKVWW